MTGAARVAVLTVSDRSFRGERADASGPAVADAARRLLDAEVVELRVVPDERDDIEWNLRRLADTGTADIVLTTGGTGLGPRDVTPQATAAVLDYEVPGLAEAMRASSRAVFAAADLS
ncbi:molybdenum cofactor biosynthesis protein, partial [Acidobacteria bacterium ACD]|nr:molybdenum cofactor biosynthesis protein [Acidobacteria bacterium ACD]